MKKTGAMCGLEHAFDDLVDTRAKTS